MRPTFKESTSGDETSELHDFSSSKRVNTKKGATKKVVVFVNDDCDVNAIKKLPENPLSTLQFQQEKISALFRHGNKAFAERDYENALGRYEEVIRLITGKGQEDDSTLAPSQVSSLLIGTIDEKMKNKCILSRAMVNIAAVQIQEQQYDEAMHTLGVALRVAGNISKYAYRMSEQVRPGEKCKLLFHAHSVAADVHQNIGLLHWRLEDNQRALEKYKEALVVRRHCLVLATKKAELFKRGLVEEQLGHETENEIENCKLELADLLTNIGIVNDRCNNYETCAAAYKESLVWRLKVISDMTHPDVISTVSRLGAVHLEGGHYSDALECYEDLRNILRDKLGDNHLLVADVSNTLADITYKMKDWEMSEKESLTAIDICSSRSIEDGVTTSTLNEASLKLAISMNNLGKVYAKMGKMDDSFQSFGKALYIRQSILGNDHKDVVESLFASADAYFESGKKYAEAMFAYREALLIVSRKKSSTQQDDYYVIGDTLTKIGQIEMKQGKKKSAVKHFRRALLAWDRFPGEEKYRKVAGVHFHLAFALRQICLSKEAMEQFNLALAKYRESGLSSNHPDVIATIHGMVQG